VRFGGVWTAVIVTQVAFTVAFPVTLFFQQQEGMRIRSHDVGFAAGEYLAMQLTTDAPDSAAHAARMVPALERLRQRVAAEPGVRGVTFADRLPRASYSQRRIELDEPAAADLMIATIASVDPSYFDALEAPVLAGRAFTLADLAPNARVMIVDQGFVDLHLQGRSPIGRQVRLVYRDAPRAALVRDRRRGEGAGDGPRAASRTHRGDVPADGPGSAGPVNMMVHAPGDPLSLTRARPRDRRRGGPGAAHLGGPARWTRSATRCCGCSACGCRITFGVTAVAISSRWPGIYAVLSFTVARRTREIGVRVALGAPRPPA
jgi:hypothetical protein